MNEERLIRFIEERLSLLQLPVVKSDFSNAAIGHSFSHIIDTVIPGRSSDTLILVIPLNHEEQAPPAEDGSFGIACGLALLDYLRNHKPALTVRILFLGGEFESGGEYYLGTAHFLNTFYPEKQHAVLYLRFKSDSSRLVVRYGGRGTAAPLWLMRTAVDTLSASGVPFTVRGIDVAVYRSGFEIEKTPLCEYYQHSIPALMLESSGPYTDTRSLDQKIHAVLDFIARFAGAFPDGIPEEWDRHYLLLTFPFLPPLFLSETAYCVLLLVFTFIGLSLMAFRIPGLKKYAASLKRNFWNVPFFMVAVFLILFGATFVLEGLCTVRHFPTLWREAPVPFFLLKVGILLTAGALLYRAGLKLPFSKKGIFYTGAAVFFMTLCILVVAVINISFVLYFLWPFLFIIVGSLLRPGTLKMFCFGIAPLALVFLLVQVFSLSEPRLVHIFLFDKVFGNFLFTVIALPYLLLLIRIRFLLPFRRQGLFRSRSFLFMSGAAFVTAGCCAFILFFNPYANRPQPVLAERIMDFNRRTHQLRLSSPAPLGEIVLRDESGLHPLNTSSRYYLIPLSGMRDYVSAQYSVVGFASRRNVRFSIRFLGYPFKIKATVFSKNDFKIYDSNFPVQKNDENRYGISIGINPPHDLTLELTLPMERTYDLELEVLYKGTQADMEIQGKNIAVENRLLFRKTIGFSL